MLWTISNSSSDLFCESLDARFAIQFSWLWKVQYEPLCCPDRMVSTELVLINDRLADFVI